MAYTLSEYTLLKYRFYVIITYIYIYFLYVRDNFIICHTYVSVYIYIYIYMLYTCKIHTGLWPNTHHKCMNHSGALVEHGGAILLCWRKPYPSFLVGEVWSSSHGWITDIHTPWTYLKVTWCDMFLAEKSTYWYTYSIIYIYIYTVYLSLHPFFWKREKNSSWITKLPFTQLRPAGTVVPETLGVCEFGSSQSQKRRSTLWLFNSLLWKPWPIMIFPARNLHL